MVNLPSVHFLPSEHIIIIVSTN